MEPVIPDFAGDVFEIVKLDRGLHLWTKDNWEFVLRTPVLVTTTSSDGPHQSEVEVDVAAGPVPELLSGIEGSAIVQVLVSEEGHLGIQLPDMHLTVPASPQFEAWQIGGDDGERLICTGGGELVHFPPLRSDENPDEAP
jgi:hypothetical protein